MAIEDQYSAIQQAQMMQDQPSYTGMQRRQLSPYQMQMQQQALMARNKSEIQQLQPSSNMLSDQNDMNYG